MENGGLKASRVLGLTRRRAEGIGGDEVTIVSRVDRGVTRLSRVNFDGRIFQKLAWLGFWPEAEGSGLNCSFRNERWWCRGEVEAVALPRKRANIVVVVVGD